MFKFQSDVAAVLLSADLRLNSVRWAAARRGAVQLIVIDGAPVKIEVQFALRSAVHDYDKAPMVRTSVLFTEEERAAFAAVDAAMHRVIDQAADDISIQIAARALTGED